MTATTYLVTGGAGFIGSALVHHLRRERPGARLVVLDALTYAGHLENLEGLEEGAGYRFVHGDIADAALVGREVRALSRREVVEHDHAMAGREQVIDRVGADEAGAAGDDSREHARMVHG